MGVHKLFFIIGRMIDFRQQAEKLIGSKYMIYMINR